MFYLASKLAELSETGVDGKFPEIRNLRLIELDEEQCKRISSSGYSFEFEALVEGEWRPYGPNCYGNWTCLRDFDGMPDTRGLELPAKYQGILEAQV